LFIAWSALFHVRPAPAKFQCPKTRNLVDANWKTNILRRGVTYGFKSCKSFAPKGKKFWQKQIKNVRKHPVLFTSVNNHWLCKEAGSSRQLSLPQAYLSSDLSLDGPQLPLHIFTSSVNSAENGIYDMHQRHTCQRLNVYIIQHHTANHAQSNQTFRCSVITTRTLSTVFQVLGRAYVWNLSFSITI
jgi:hypothetical protein